MKTKQSTGFFLGKNYLSWLLYGGIAFLLMLMQTAPRFFPVIGNARPAPLILFVVCVAILEGPRTGAVIAVIGGLLWDLYSFRLFGLNAMLLLLISVAVGLLVQWLLRANFLSGMILCVGGVLTHALFEWLLCYALFLHEETGAVLWQVYLPNALYTVLLAPFMYWCVLFIARMLRRKQRG